MQRGRQRQTNRIAVRGAESNQQIDRLLPTDLPRKIGIQFQTDSYRLTNLQKQTDLHEEK